MGLPNSTLSKHINNQIIRAATSSALNYGEAQSAESRRDFIHKLKIVAKELRESNVCLKIISKSFNLKASTELDNVLQENNELISIFVKSIATAKKNLNQKNQ